MSILTLLSKAASALKPTPKSRASSKKASVKKLLAIVLIADIIIGGVLIITSGNKSEIPVEQRITESSIQRICELATLECYYHNVTEWSQDSNWIGYGAKRLWLEYDGLVRVGIKGSQIKVSDPDPEGVITVSMPKATILDKDLDEETLYEIDSESALWGFIPLYSSVSTEERKNALYEAQEDMLAGASKNGMILNEARDRAKMVIEKNIVWLGEAAGKQYTVKFVDADDTSAEQVQ
ncbi:MAG: DUF4230 domain-containing protein [Clostridia bacterium]|nr:DUF4230 domain-containing protein [Clostridia bacterium]MBQ6646635.1 DUF4230 domain-containing protein [Clostridia bacterium]